MSISAIQCPDCAVLIRETDPNTADDQVQCPNCGCVLSVDQLEHAIGHALTLLDPIETRYVWAILTAARGVLNSGQIVINRGAPPDPLFVCSSTVGMDLCRVMRAYDSLLEQRDREAQDAAHEERLREQMENDLADEHNAHQKELHGDRF